MGREPSSSFESVSNPKPEDDWGDSEAWRAAWLKYPSASGSASGPSPGEQPEPTNQALIQEGE